MILTSKVAAFEFDGNDTAAFKRAFDLIGGIADLNSAGKPAVVKVGVFSQKAENHTSLSVLTGIINNFDKSPRIFITESDNYKGSGSERLQIWKQLYTERVIPFNLSDDRETMKAKVVDQEMYLSHILCKPNAFIDTHILRSFGRGSILKNLFGCIPDTKRVKYHKILPKLLADVYEAIGGIDLAVLDGTFLWRGAGEAPIRMNTVLAGRDAVAVETVGAVLAGLNTKKIPVIQEFVRRGLGEGDIRNIEVVGTSFDHLKRAFLSVAKSQKKRQSDSPQTWSGKVSRALKELTREGYFKRVNKRASRDVIKALKKRGIPTMGKEDKIKDFLVRRIQKGKLKKSKVSNEWIYWVE